MIPTTIIVAGFSITRYNNASYDDYKAKYKDNQQAAWFLCSVYRFNVIICIYDDDVCYRVLNDALNWVN